jgi:hypothetical protein
MKLIQFTNGREALTNACATWGHGLDIICFNYATSRADTVRQPVRQFFFFFFKHEGRIARAPIRMPAAWKFLVRVKCKGVSERYGSKQSVQDKGISNFSRKIKSRPTSSS